MKTALRNRGIATMVLAALSFGAYQASAQVTQVQIDTGTPATPLYAVGPIYMSSTLFYRYSRFAYLYTQQELAAVGITPGTEISTVGWMKATANSAAGPALFKIYMKNSSTGAYSDPTAQWPNLNSGSTLVYTNAAQDIPTTASPNYIDFTLDAPFTYTGGSLEILTEWDISAASTPIATGGFDWVNTTVVDRIYASGNSSLPASLSSTMNNVNMDDRRPVIQFTVDISTAIREKLNAMISIYPNPAEQFIQISNEGMVAFENIVITDAVGKVVRMEGASGIQAIRRINVEDLQSGPYILSIQTEAGRIVKRFTVL